MYGLIQKIVNLKCSVILIEMFRVKPSSQFAEWHHRFLSCALNIEDLILKNVCKYRK
jgi:hypothetical protein